MAVKTEREREREREREMKRAECRLAKLRLFTSYRRLATFHVCSADIKQSFSPRYMIGIVGFNVPLDTV